jgi:hypothetical protein
MPEEGAMIEVALVFNPEGRALYWHQPMAASTAAIPDSRTLWEVLWQHRHELGGVAHSHPWHGRAAPSQTDITTWSACERGLGVRLVWPIVTLDEVACFGWEGPDELRYTRRDQVLLHEREIAELRRRSREEETNHE